MGKSTKIHDINSLDREIERLQQEATQVEGRLGNNIDHLRKNALGFIVSSIFCGQNDEHKKDGRTGFFRNEKLNTFFSKMSDSMSERVGDFISNLFRKQKQE